MANMTLNDARLDETFAALANSTRRAILARLAEGEAGVLYRPDRSRFNVMVTAPASARSATRVGRAQSDG